MYKHNIKCTDMHAGRVRVLLRREQVLKLACNHNLTADMKLQPLLTSETAWCWSALDYIDSEGRHEQLAVKFKVNVLIISQLSAVYLITIIRFHIAKDHRFYQIYSSYLWMLLRDTMLARCSVESCSF